MRQVLAGPKVMHEKASAFSGCSVAVAARYLAQDIVREHLVIMGRWWSSFGFKFCISSRNILRTNMPMAIDSLMCYAVIWRINSVMIDTKAVYWASFLL